MARKRTTGSRFKLGEPCDGMLDDFCAAYLDASATTVIRNAVVHFIETELASNPGAKARYDRWRISGDGLAPNQPADRSGRNEHTRAERISLTGPELKKGSRRNTALLEHLAHHLIAGDRGNWADLTYDPGCGADFSASPDPGTIACGRGGLPGQHEGQRTS